MLGRDLRGSAVGRCCLLALALTLVLSSTSGCKESHAPAQAPGGDAAAGPPVFVAPPELVSYVETLEFPGNLMPTDIVQIRCRVSGYLEEPKFEDGADVQKGDLLFVIEPEPFEVALAMAKAAHDKAVASLTLAKAELARTEPLVARGALSQQELDLKSAAVASATADVASTAAAIRQAELNLSYTRVTAPISGRIGRHLVDQGNLVEAQSTLLTTIESYAPIYAMFNVSENDLLRLEEASRPENGGTGKPITDVLLSIPGATDYIFAGKLDFTQLGVDQSTGTQLRRAIFENADRRLLPGMFVRIRVPLGEKRPRLMVPERAVNVDQLGEYLLVVNKDNIVERRDVKLGVAQYGLRLVEEGVTEDDQIVVNGLQRARVGAPVTPMPVDTLPGVDQEFLSKNRVSKEGNSESSKPSAEAASGE